MHPPFTNKGPREPRGKRWKDLFREMLLDENNLPRMMDLVRCQNLEKKGGSTVQVETRLDG